MSPLLATNPGCEPWRAPCGVPHSRPFPSTVGAVLALLLAGGLVSLADPPRSLTSGGGHSAAGTLALDASIGGVVGLSSGGVPGSVVKAGFIGQLYEVKHLVIRPTPALLTAGQTSQLQGYAELDDSTILRLAPSEIAWEPPPPGSPVASITTDGVLTAVPVGAFRETTVAGTYAGLRATTQVGVATAPTVTTLTATAVQPDGSGIRATLNGRVNPGGRATLAWFEWGTTTNYGLATDAISLGAGVDAVPVSFELRGLDEGSVYHYRSAARNDLGEVVGADQVFGRRTVNVVSLADAGPGSLRQAIADAGAGFIIRLDVAGILTLTSGELVLTQDLAILGPGPAQLTLSGGGSNRLFQILAPATVTLADLTLADGRAPSGGAVLSQGTLAIERCVLQDNQAFVERGGAIAGGGRLSVHGSLFQRNRAATDGGAIDSASGWLTVDQCAFVANEAGRDGGAVRLGARVPESPRTLRGLGRTSTYTAPRFDGAPGTWVRVSPGVPVTFEVDYTTGYEDGGAGCPGCLTQHHLGIEGVFADCHDLGTEGGTSGQVNRTFTAPSIPGIYHLTQTATWWYFCDQFGLPPLVNAPEAAVAVLVVGAPHVPVVNTTFSGNTAETAGGAIAADGGVDLDLIHCTLTANAAPTGGGLNVAAGAGIVWLSNTIIANNQAEVEPDIGGTAQSGGHNLIGSAVTLVTPQASDALDLDPRLGPLEANASLLPSHAPLPASPALDSANPDFSPGVDQRGFPRPERGSPDTVGTDRGAVEVQPPRLLPPPNQITFEDRPLGPLRFSVADPETPAGELEVSAVASVPGLFPPGSLIIDGENGTRLLTLLPAPDQNGSAQIELRVTDAHGVTTTATFAITLLQVNDPPSFTLRDAGVVAPRSSGLTEVPGFATDISAGPPDEAGQELSFQVTHDNSALFVVPPALSPAGTLSFVTRPGVVGRARCSVVLTDSGGTANGGSDRSAPQSFVIEIVSPPAISAHPVAPLWELEPGSSASLLVQAEGTAPMAYQWSRNGSDLPGATNAVLQLADLRPPDGGDYHVRVFNAWGSVTSQIAPLRVGLPLSGPMLLREPQDQDVPVGGTLVLSAEAAGEPPLHYQWRRNGTPLTDGDGSDPERLPLLRRGAVGGAQSPVLTITDFRPADAGLFQLFIENARGVTASRRVRVRPSGVDPLTLVDGPPESGVLVTSLAGVRTASTAGFAAITDTNGVEQILGWLRWRALGSGSVTFTTAGSAYDTQLAVFLAPDPGWVAIDDDNGGYLTSYVSFNTRPGAEYWIAAVSLAALSGDVVLSWQTRPETTPVITAQPANVVARLGETRSFRVTVDSPTEVAYQWRRQGEPLLESEHHRGVREPELIVPSLEPGDIGVYTVVVSNDSGQSVISAPAVLDLAQGNDLPSVASGYKPEALLQQLRHAPRPVTLRSRRLMQGQGVSAGTILSDNFRPRGQGSQSQTVVLGGSSRWYELPVPANGLYTLETTNSDFDAVLQVYAFSRTNTADPGTLVASDDNSAPDGRNARVRFPACIQPIYLAVVDGRDGAAGRFNLQWEVGPGSTPPQWRWYPVATSSESPPGYAVVDLAEANGIATIHLVYAGADYCALQPVRTFTAAAAGDAPAQVWFPVSPGLPYLVLAEPLPGVPPAEMHFNWSFRPASTPAVSLSGGRVRVRWRPDGLRLEHASSLERVWLEVPPPAPLPNGEAEIEFPPEGTGRFFRVVPAPGQ